MSNLERKGFRRGSIPTFAIPWLLLMIGAGHALSAGEQGLRQSAAPNILLVTADDLGLQLGCYGDTVAHTPHLDRFASEGARFARAFVTQASCSPSRSSMLTGLYPHQNGQIGLSHRGYSMHDDTIPSLPSRLREAGYATGIIGKLHVAPESCFSFDFKETNSQATRDVEHVAARTEAFLAQHGNRPFFLMVNFSDPHSPYLRDVAGHPRVKVERDAVTAVPFTGQDLDQPSPVTADYYCCVNRFDEGFGLLMEVLSDRNLAADTLVVVIGDHGPPFPRGKVTCYEAGLQIPWLVRWPGRIQPGSVHDAFVSTVDLMPTFLEAAGAELPARQAGKSLVSLLQGGAASVRDYLFGEFTSHVPVHYLPQRTVRDDRYKLRISLMFQPDALARLKREGIDPAQEFQSSFSDIPAIGLYDLENDPHEFHNLAADPQYGSVLKRLQDELLAWREASGDPTLDLDYLVALTQSHVQVREKYEGLEPSRKTSR